MKLENIMLSELNQTQKGKYCMTSVICEKKSQTYNKSREFNGGWLVLEGGENTEILVKGYKVSVI